MADIVRVKDQYYVRASSALADDRTRVLKYGDTFAVFNRYGNIEALGPSKFGLFYAETRHLSRLAMKINQQQPLLLSSTVREDNAFLSVDLTNVDTPMRNNGTLAKGTLHVFRLQFLQEGACYEHIRLLNYGVQPIEFSIAFEFQADFADIFEVRGTKRTKHGEQLPAKVDDSSAILSYQGLDGVLRRTQLHFSPRPKSLTVKEAQFTITLEPKEEKSIFNTISCERDSGSARIAPFQVAFSTLEREFQRTGLDECRVRTSSESFNALLTRSSSDLRMLIEGNPEGPYPYAGVPWFNTIFGRDGIITAFQCLWLAPRIAEGVLNYLAQTQATEEIPEQDAEPGKIIHEMRRGEMAVTKEVPFARYYGSVDSTPLFVMLAGAYLLRTNHLSFLKEIWPNIARAISWIDKYGDCDGDGFVEYKQRSSKGLVQQGWKDSTDSVFHADGRLAEPPIALCEVQGYVYAAKRAAAMIARALRKIDLAEKLLGETETLRKRFEEAFWCEPLNMYALALDGKKQQCRVRASNAGHALFSGIARPDHAKAVASALMSEQMYSGWGIRTVASSEPRYNPMSYHNGSVWPHDNSLIGQGFSKYGLHGHAMQLLSGLYEASLHMDLQRLPELFCGFHKRSDSSGPTLYPVACSPQAWAAGSIYLLLRACLGLAIRARERKICFTNPVLPPFFNELRIENLRVADSSADLILRRESHGVAVDVIRKQGDIEIIKAA